MTPAELRSKPQLLRAYHNNTIVNQAVQAWAYHGIDKTEAYEAAMIVVRQPAFFNARTISGTMRVLRAFARAKLFNEYRRSRCE